MDWIIYENDVRINTIHASEEFVKEYCEANGYTYQERVIVPHLSPAEQRKQAYNTEKIISWVGEMLTVTEAATLWGYYAAEGSDKATELTALIVTAKADIREKYPDEQESVG